jgi:hypothetical protein
LELRAFVSRCVEAGLPIIPVLLPNVTSTPKDLLFLRELNYVQFGDGIDEVDPLERLE